MTMLMGSPFNGRSQITHFRIHTFRKEFIHTVIPIVPKIEIVIAIEIDNNDKTNIFDPDFDGDFDSEKHILEAIKA